MTHLVELRGIGKRFAGGTDVLSGVDLEIESGESLAIVGPSGSGKSTLLNIIGGLLPPTSGSVLFDGVDLTSLGRDELAAFRNQQIGYVFQSHHLLPQCTALENVLIPTLTDASGAARRNVTDLAKALLHEVGLAERLDHRPARMSGGECQRVAVVRALINEPRLLLADEPTGSLDERSADRLGELLCHLNEEKSVTLITVTHSPRLAAQMNRRYELRLGGLHTAESGR